MNRLTKLITLTSLIFIIFSSAARADVIEEGDYISFSTSLYTKHWTPKPEHNNHQKLINVELEKEDNWLYGLALFKNSFGQNTQFAYVGYKWMLPYTEDKAYFKLAGGPMHGYKGEYKDKIPLNQLGVAPAVLPSFGFSHKAFRSELVIFGAAGLMLTVGYKVPAM